MQVYILLLAKGKMIMAENGSQHEQIIEPKFKDVKI